MHRDPHAKDHELVDGEAVATSSSSHGTGRCLLSGTARNVTRINFKRYILVAIEATRSVIKSLIKRNLGLREVGALGSHLFLCRCEKIALDRSFTHLEGVARGVHSTSCRILNHILACMDGCVHVGKYGAMIDIRIVCKLHGCPFPPIP